jgi:hypothetical protein
MNQHLSSNGSPLLRSTKEYGYSMSCGKEMVKKQRKQELPPAPEN